MYDLERLHVVGILLGLSLWQKDYKQQMILEWPLAAESRRAGQRKS